MEQQEYLQPDIKSMEPGELKELVVSEGEKAFRSRQIFGWLHKSRVSSYDEMKNLPAGLRQRFAEKYPLRNLQKVEVQQSAIDGTRKYLFGCGDGHVIESVWMKYHHGNSVCISSQVGCRMGCRFCASTLGGLVRSLTASEMLEQIYRITEDTGERVSNIVVMGTGEPFDNYEQLIRFIHLISDPEGYGLSRRSITVSTCGIVPMIRRFAEEQLPVTLALSLHAPTDEKRRQLMPIANRYSLKEIMEACIYYSETTGRRMTYEYALAAGQNDTPEDAEGLYRLLKGQNAHVNLIPVNPVKERDFVRPGKNSVGLFQNILEKKGINVTIRRELGSDIDGACGQLRKKYMNDREKNQ